jgi:hypothetical protein
MRIIRDWRFGQACGSAAVLAAAFWAGSDGASHAQSPAVPAPAATQAPPVTSAVCDIVTTERVVAVGDVHGAFEQFVAILREAKIIDSRNRWAGGRAILVQTGDTTDRGPDSRKVMDLLRKLTDEAAKAGGRVHALLGNHEAMRLLGINRDVGPGEFKAFRTPDSEDLRNRYLDLVVADNAKRAKAAGTEFDDRAFRKQFLENTPPGSIEMQLAFGPKGDYGKWLRDRDTMIKINGVLFMHGGPSTATAAMGCAAVNARVRSELTTVVASDPNLNQTLIAGTDGPLWYRGLAEPSVGVQQPEVEAILKAFGARAVVVGHTVPEGFRIRSRFGGLVVQIDTGMLNGEFFPNGVPSALEMQGNAWTAIYQGQRVPLQPAPPQG